MRALDTNRQDTSTMIGGYGAKMAEAIAVRRAMNAARTARIEAEMSIRARSEFLANMNHELRTPLNAIIGFATMLRENDSYQLGDEQQANYAEYILQSADLLLAHINTILETAELDGGAITFNSGAINLSAALKDAITRAKIAADASGVTIEDKSNNEEIIAWGDPERIGQAIDHVLRTALKLSPENGRVLARVVAGKNGWPEINVRDRSDGLAPDAISKVLNVFDEVHRGLDRSFDGPGVGLAIAKTFVEMQGGRFAINSRIGEGTLVKMSFPPPKADEGAADDAPTQTSTQQTNQRIVDPADRARMTG